MFEAWFEREGTNTWVGEFHSLEEILPSFNPEDLIGHDLVVRNSLTGEFLLLSDDDAVVDFGHAAGAPCEWLPYADAFPDYSLMYQGAGKSLGYKIL